jgi:hypothetical protein
MQSVQATFCDGRLELMQPVDWPNGTRAEVIPLSGEYASATWPAGYFESTAGALTGEDFERPAEGDLPEREVW